MKLGGLDQGQEERIQKMGNWMDLLDLVVGLGAAADAATARALIDGVRAHAQ